MKFKLCFLLLFPVQLALAQDSLYARRMLDTLTSSHFWGRGYTRQGMDKAAQFITAQFKTFGLQPMNGSGFVQPFSYPVNTFPGKLGVSINGTALTPGQSFIISPESRGTTADADLVQLDSAHFVNREHRILVTLENKLTWSVALQAADYTLINIDRKTLTQVPQHIRIDAENVLDSAFTTGNVCGMVKGTLQPDSVILLSCHYDHLGGMGNATYFPGANDNASGVAMLLSLAKYYAAHPQPYSIAFICFSGEEAGLLGSHFFVEHPLLPLTHIRFMVNMDIVGTGNEGITVVNALIHSKEFDLLKEENEKAHYLSKIYARGKTANSDHYWFTENGVPAFYVYTMGGVKAYHDVFDISKTLPLNGYNSLFKLLTNFNSALMRQPQAVHLAAIPHSLNYGQ